MLKKLAVAVDGSKSAERALATAIELAKALGASLAVVTVAPLHVVPTGTATAIPIIHDAEVKVHQEVLARAKDQAALAGLKPETVLLDGLVGEEILRYLDERPPDLFIIGARGLSAGQRLFLGSVSDAIIHHAKLPVLVVRG